ncbi:GntP family permease [Clostridium carnis]
MLGVLSIILTLVALMYFAYRGVAVIILAPVLGMLAALLSGEIPALHALSNLFLPAATEYIKNYFPVFLTGAIFGKLMGTTGAASIIADFVSKKFGKERAILAIVVATALLTYGGVSLFVVVFAIYPIGATLLKNADIPKRFLPGAIALGGFTFTMTALPGSPQTLNTMPTVYLGTDIYAGPILGIIAALIMFIGGVWYLNVQVKKCKSKGEGYGIHLDEVNSTSRENSPGILISFLPIIIVFILNFVLTNFYFTRESVINKYTSIGGKVDGTWPVVIALTVAILFILIAMKKYIKDVNKVVTSGAEESILPIFNTAAQVGYGGVIKALTAFTTLKLGLVSLAIPAVYKVGISTTLLAGIVGSSSGGTAIALEVMANDFLAMGVSPSALHRIILVASGGLDSLPHCGAVITLLAVCKLNHKQSYKYIAVVTMAIPLIALAVITTLHLLTGIV